MVVGFAFRMQGFLTGALGGSGRVAAAGLSLLGLRLLGFFVTLAFSAGGSLGMAIPGP